MNPDSSSPVATPATVPGTVPAVPPAVPRMPPGTQVWSTEVAMPVSVGCRRLSLLPAPCGVLLVVDSTGADGYGQVVLGELRRIADDRFAAHDPYGVEVGTGQVTDLVKRLFDSHPARTGFLDCGMEDGVDTSAPTVLAIQMNNGLLDEKC